DAPLSGARSGFGAAAFGSSFGLSSPGPAFGSGFLSRPRAGSMFGLGAPALAAGSLLSSGPAAGSPSFFSGFSVAGLPAAPDIGSLFRFWGSFGSSLASGCGWGFSCPGAPPSGSPRVSDGAADLSFGFIGLGCSGGGLGAASGLAF